MDLETQGFVLQLLYGAWVTVKLSIVATILGLVLGFVGALCKTSNNFLLKMLGGTYTTIVRGVPETLWVLIIYFGTVTGFNLLGSYVGNPSLSLSPFWAGVIALGLCFGAYATESIRGALLTIPKGQYESGIVLGLTKKYTFLRVILPQIIRVALPSLGNLYLILLKDTALVSLISLDELMRKAGIASTETKEPFFFFMIAAIIYLFLTIITTLILNYFEKRVSYGFRKIEL